MTHNRSLQSVLSLVTIAVAGVMSQQAVAADNKADVIVYGSTPGGVCAAIAAAREGADVILLEATDHVGGLNTGGLSHSDSNQCDRSTVVGLFDEWHRRIEQDYASRGITLPYKVSVKNHAIWTYEPHVAARVTKQMLDEAKVRVLTKRYMQSVRKDGPRITEIIASDGAYEAALHHVREASKPTPHLRHLAGVLRWLLHDLEGAKLEYQAALTLAPDDQLRAAVDRDLAALDEILAQQQRARDITTRNRWLALGAASVFLLGMAAAIRWT